MINNYEKVRRGEQLSTLDGVDNTKFQEYVNYRKKVTLENESAENKKSGLNIFGPELNELLLSRLNFKINLKNIKIFYEYNSKIDMDFGVNKSFSLCFNINNFKLRSEDVAGKLSESGTFKDFVKLEELIKSLPN